MEETDLRFWFVFFQGGYATHIVLNQDNLVKIPDFLIEKYSKNNEFLQISAAIPLQAMTAHYLVTSAAPVQKGKKRQIFSDIVFFSKNLHTFFWSEITD